MSEENICYCCGRKIKKDLVEFSGEIYHTDCFINKLKHCKVEVGEKHACNSEEVSPI